MNTDVLRQESSALVAVIGDGPADRLRGLPKKVDQQHEAGVRHGFSLGGDDEDQSE